MNELARNEVFPVLGDGNDVSTYAQYVEKSQIIVWCGKDSSEDNDPVKTLGPLITLIQQHSRKDILISPKVFIYCSGIMIYGHDELVRSEDWPIAETAYAKKRRAIETHILRAESIIPIILRPGWVYGRNSSNNSDFFVVPEDGRPTVYGSNLDRRYSWIHIDDLGEAFVAAAKKGKAVSHEIFNVVGYDIPKWRDLLERGMRLAGYKGPIHTAADRGSFADELADANVVLSPQKAIRLLDWQPKIFGLLDNMEIYYQTFLAEQKHSKEKKQ